MVFQDELDMATRFDVKGCIIYAQQRILANDSSTRQHPFGFFYQRDVQPAVQAIMNLYMDRAGGWEGHNIIHAFSISEMCNKWRQWRYIDTLREIVEEARRRGYNPDEFVGFNPEHPELSEFDPVILATPRSFEEGKQPFDLDEALGKYYMERFDPQEE
jgi:hypothetical protein